MEEEDQEQRFVCKICGKNFISGMSLGGHMRSHLALISAKKQEDRISNKISEMGLECGGDDDDDNYGLRENPKKTWRVSDPKQRSEKILRRRENQCRECGKEFPSFRALNGHMKCHSIKESESNLCKQCGKGFGSMRALFGHMRHHSKRSRESNESPERQLDYEFACPIRRKRSKMRYKVNLSLSNSNASCSSYVSEVDDELEEAAVALIMMSRGETNWVQFNSVFESSENKKTVICEDDQGGKLVCGGDDESWEMEKPSAKLNSSVPFSGYSLCEKSESELGELDSGFLIKGEKKAEFEASIGEFKKFVPGGESGLELFDAEIDIGNDPTEVELEREFGLDQDESEMMKSISSKKATLDDPNPELGEIFRDGVNENTASTAVVLENSEMKREYKCRTCDKVFHSYRALGGHRSGHKTIGCGFVVKIDEKNETDLNSNIDNLEFNGNSVELKKVNDHECPICFKVFPSGQALGGHKRAHFVGFSDHTSKESVFAKEEELTDNGLSVCDLNLPVSLGNEVGDGFGLKPWWVGSDHLREPLVISN